MSPNTTPNAERLSAGRLEATTLLLGCTSEIFGNANTFGRSSLPHFRSLLDKGRSSFATAGAVALASHNPSLGDYARHRWVGQFRYQTRGAMGHSGPFVPPHRT